jgi:hypothetical protein
MPGALLNYAGSGPTINGNVISLDEHMDQPKRLLRDVAKLVDQDLFMDKLFTPAGDVSGGSVLFERPNPIATDLFPERDIKTIAEGSELPIVTFTRGIPMAAFPREIGGKFFLSKQARKRNNPKSLTNALTALANTISVRLEILGFAELTSVVASETRFMNGTSWSTFAGTAINARTGIVGPVSDIMAAQAAADLEQRSTKYNSIVLHTNQAMAIGQAYPGMTIEQVLAPTGITDVIVTSRYTAGRALLYVKGQVGSWFNEFPLEEDQWDEKNTRRRWFSSTISPMYVVDNQFKFMELRAIA